MSFSLEIPAFLSMFWRVPFFRGLPECIGTGMVTAPSSDCFWYIRWLPVCLLNTKPSFSRALQISCPLTCGSLPIDYKLKLVRLMRLGKMRDVFYSNHFNVTFSGVFKHINGLFDGITFCGYIKFRAINYITSLFSRAEFSSDFYFFHAMPPSIRLRNNVVLSGEHVNKKYGIRRRGICGR